MKHVFLLASLIFSSLCLHGQNLDQTAEPTAAATPQAYIIPVQEAIDEANLFLMRFAIKKAISEEIEIILLDINTPGGRLDVTLEMMEMLDKFPGQTLSYINPDAISAGAYIAAATQEIYFAPKGSIGAAAVITSTGEDVQETAKMKIDSYLRAKLRNLDDETGYRADVLRAMMDETFVLTVEDEILKPAGELLTLTSQEATQTYGENQQALLGLGIFESAEELLDHKFGASNYSIKAFELDWSQNLAIALKKISPLLIALGLLGLFIEFKTPGFAFFGIGGITCLVVVFASNYVAGLAGYEIALFLLLGIILLGIEIFLIPGTLVAGALGVLCILGSLVWSLSDFWPNEPIQFDSQQFSGPLGDVAIGLLLATLAALLLSKWLPKTTFGKKFILDAELSNDTPASLQDQDTAHAHLPAIGSTGIALTSLFPSGTIQIDDKNYEASTPVGTIDKGSAISVIAYQDFSLIVEQQKPSSSESA